MDCFLNTKAMSRLFVTLMIIGKVPHQIIMSLSEGTWSHGETRSSRKTIARPSDEAYLP